MTLDPLGTRHSATSLEATYAAAAALAGSGLEFVLACVPTPAGRFTVPFADGALSATPWRDGRAVGDSGLIEPGLAAGNAAMLARLHAAEPHAANQLRTAGGILLVDWESLTLAPRERDLRPLVDSGHADLVDPDPAMLELFDLEWRLDEIAAYADWFAAPHIGTASDAVAYAGLVEALERPDRAEPVGR